MKSWFFEKNQINQKMEKEIQIRDEKGDMRTETEEIQRLRIYFKNLYSTNLEYLKEIDEFLDVYDPPKLNQDQISP